MIKWEEIDRLTKQGKTNKEIMDLLGCSRGSIQRIRRNLRSGKTKHIANTDPILKKLGIFEDEYIELLKHLYETGKSQHAIAEELKIHICTIEKHFKRYCIPTRYPWDAPSRHKFANLTKREHEALDGMLLGDGNLNPSSIAARLTYGCEYRKTLYDIEAQFKNLTFTPHWCSKRNNWHFKSHSYIDLLNEYQRWYINNKKDVPEDIVLTPLMAYWWYIGDGYVVNYGLCLCTDSFTLKGINILRNALFKHGFDATHVKSRNRIRIKSCSRKAFLSWMKEDMEVSTQYEYKWKDRGSPRRKI